MNGFSKASLKLAGMAAAIAVLCLCTPPDLPVCAFRSLTGRPCPLCGLTHAFFALAKGHFAEALHWHALSPLAAVLLVGVIWNSPRMARLWTPSLCAFACYGILRIVAA